MNNQRYSQEQREWFNDLQEKYRAISKGICMTKFGINNSAPTDDCDGPIGCRHAIAKRHLRLIADPNSQIRANKETDSFEGWTELYDDLQLAPISQFTAGKWSCQRHDERFAGIDAQRIDLSDPENLFKAVYRVVLRQNHLTLARWNAIFTGIQTEAGWERFKETAFDTHVNDEIADNAVIELRNEAHAIIVKMRELEKRLTRKEWLSFDYRAILLESKPMVAGWRCLKMKFPCNDLHVNDIRRHWKRHVELAYMIIIPQECGHAIITACEPRKRFRVDKIVKIHNYIPKRENPNQPYHTEMHLMQRISQKIWELDEIGMAESLYQSWPQEIQKEVQLWMKVRARIQSTPLVKLSSRLPSFF